MTQNTDFETASSEVIIDALCRRIDQIRLSRNISQAELAQKAGVSRSTMTRLADGRAISLDSFVRVMRALDLTEHLAALLPDPGVRPIDRLQFDGAGRQRAGRSQEKAPSGEWTWGDQK